MKEDAERCETPCLRITSTQLTREATNGDSTRATFAFRDSDSSGTWGAEIEVIFGPLFGQHWTTLWSTMRH